MVSSLYMGIIYFTHVQYLVKVFSLALKGIRESNIIEFCKMYKMLANILS